MGTGILVGYFSKQDEARKALRKLAQEGFIRTALVSRDADGDIRVSDPFLWRSLLNITLITGLSALFGYLATLLMPWPNLLSALHIDTPLTLILVSTAVGALAGLPLLQRSIYGIAPQILRNHARWLVSGESVLILRARVASLQRPVALLRESGDIPPALFIMHPRWERRAESRSPEVRLTLAQLIEHALRHAGEQRVDPETLHTTELIKRVKQSRQWVRQVCEELTAASRLELKATPIADWILDNEYILEGSARDVLLNLPKNYYQQLPTLSSEPFRGLPCIYGLAKNLVSHTELRLDQENILAFIDACQSVRTLKIGELWAIPQMLRIALIESIRNLAVTALTNLRERQLADFWANRLIAANRRDSRQLFVIMTELAATEPSPSHYFCTQLVGLLYDEAAALAPVKTWLERTLNLPLHDLILKEQNRQTAEQISCGNAFTSLRHLSHLDWRKIFERLSRVDQILRRDPAGVYPDMDFTTRDRCRQAIEALSRAGQHTEEQVAGYAVKLAAEAGDDATGDRRCSHVGYWLTGEGRALLARQLDCRETLRYRLLEWVYRHHASVYSGAIAGLLFVGLVGLVRLVGPLFLLLLLIPISQLSIELVNYLILRLLPPRTLPKMDFEETGIPDAYRTLVVVPMMLVNEETLRAEVEKLEIRYLANREQNLLFSLFSDYTDAATITREDDSLLLRRAQECMASLDKRHGGGRFFLFHRERRWCKSEQKFIGWERKRGKLEELNSLIDGTRPDTAEPLVYAGDPELLKDVRFIISLDSDTRLPHATARRMVETLAHPLNQPRFDADGSIMPGSCTIIQPRVSPTLPSASASLFSRLFSDAVGIDPYTQAVSDLYQDLSGEGSYHGKGIYDVHAFSRVLSGRFPEDRVLSHDLIEGAHVRVGLASDIELYDDFPQGYQSYCSRNHRWIRGDWQIADWLLPRVPQAFGGYGTNPLSLFNRWKILDNLRRSLLPAANLALLTVAWLISPAAGAIATAVVGMQLLFHPLIQPFTVFTTLKGLRQFSLSRLLHDLLRSMVDAVLLPHQAALHLDAIVRVAYRRLISGRNLLEWTAQSTHWSAARSQSVFVARMALGSIFSAVAGVAIWRFMPDSLPQAVPWLIAWFLSPLLGWLLNLRPTVRQQAQLTATDQRFLRQVARRTWRYFSTFVNADSSWLPPDNYQVAHQNRLAMRTSPTNIGLWMTSALGGYDCGYLTINRLVESLTNTMASIDRLERYEGHLLNWYDIQTLAPLEPRYVSTVDSGNLLAALWTLEQGLDELLQAPIMDDKVFAGFRDTGAILKQVAGTERRIGFDLHVLDTFMDEWEAPLTRVIDQLRLLRRTRATLRIPLVPNGAASWAGEMEEQTEAWITTADRYLSWIEILDEKSEAELAPLGQEIIACIRRDLSRAPSLIDLAEGRIESLAHLARIRERSPQVAPSLHEWLDRLVEAFAKARWLAGETLGEAHRLSASIRRLSAGINMGFLYDARLKLFTIGYNVTMGRPDISSYDLLASEARLGSFVAIAKGDVPMEHWFSLGRPYGAISRQRVLLSWTGTMFEYLMPTLFQYSYVNSLLDKAARDAVTVQMEYGTRRCVPWGVSESAFADLDLNRTYQYKAFGVSALGLKRGLEEQVVVAPYATLLALNVAPKETVQNLKKLADMGLLAEYGFYEAMDFSRQPKRHAGSRMLQHGVIVEAYMAHHQGMAFMALTNLLHGNPFPRRFHADPRVRAFETLLQERIPTLPPLHLISTRQSQPAMLIRDLVASTGNRFTTPHTTTPRSLLLSNGAYGVMVTNSGGGYSQWNGQELTRWRSDQTCDAFGTFCYIHEADQDRLWSTTWHPTGGKIKGYSAEFALDRAVFCRTDHGIHLETEIIVSPEDDLELRRITLINRSPRTRRLNLTSYAELSMAPHNADRQHPAFNKLFIRTEAVLSQQTVLAHRRPRSEQEAPLYLAHCLVHHDLSDRSDKSDKSDKRSFLFETDRKRFIGRGRTLANPMGAVQEPGNSQGFVLDPILSLRRTITLKPGQRTQVSLLLAAGTTREQVLLLMEKYSDPHATERAMDFAWGTAQQQLQMLHIRPDDARRFQQLASHLLFPNQFLRAPAKRLEENRKGQAGLWPYAISGDCPIVLVTIGETRDTGLVRQMLQAHTYWRMHGLSVDIVILNEETGSYERPLKGQLEQMVHGHILFGATDRPGRIFLKSAAQIPDDDLKLLKAAASVVLVAARGTLAQQLGAPVDIPEPMEAIVQKRMPREKSAPLPFMELHYFNSIGGFTRDGHEYAIYLGPGVNTPAPWVNVIANPAFGTMVSETGAGFTWYGNSQRNRLTGWSNDPVLDQTTEALYIRDEDSGHYWSPTAGPVREESAYRARHGAGYTVFEHNSNGIEQELTLFVPMDENGGKPVKLQRLRLTNTSSVRRRLSVTWYLELTLGENRETSQMHVMTAWDDEAQALFAQNRYHPEYGERVSFMASSPRAESFGGDRTAFIGRNRSLSSPVAMELVRLSQKTGAGLDPCGALRISIEIGPGQQRDIICILGQGDSAEEARKLSLDYQQEQAFEMAFDETRHWWDELLGTIEVKTPELAADLLINRWLQYQSLSCRIWGRSALYQSGGAFGFRDQLQDVMAFLYARPELAREHLLLAAGRQFKEGDVQHWWHPPTGAGIRSRISDDLLWLPYAVAQYVRTTGDLAVLQEEVPFLNAPLLTDAQHELFSIPEVTFEQVTLFEHCRRAVSRGLTIGPNGLPLIGTGDWNDGMNLVGAEGKGESVWLGWFLCDLLRSMAELACLLHLPALSRTYLEDRYALIQRVERAGWDGAWYLRGRFDDGSPLGSAASSEAQIDSLPQSWAWLSGAADPLRADQALESAWQHLVKQDEQLVLLFEPPFENAQPSPGYIKGYPPGVRENGGQYTHAALWMAMAMARKGDGERAVQLLRMLNPIEHARDAESVWRYGVEPYVVAADVYRLPGRIGQGGWSWYTGSAAWMYRAWVEEVLGLRIRNGKMQIKPVIPASWPGFSLKYRHGEAVYEIRVENPDGCMTGVVWVEMDNRRMTDGVIELERGQVWHAVVVMMG